MEQENILHCDHQEHEYLLHKLFVLRIHRWDIRPVTWQQLDLRFDTNYSPTTVLGYIWGCYIGINIAYCTKKETPFSELVLTVKSEGMGFGRQCLKTCVIIMRRNDGSEVVDCGTFFWIQNNNCWSNPIIWKRLYRGTYFMCLMLLLGMRFWFMRLES